MPAYKLRTDRIYVPVKRGDSGQNLHKPKSLQMFDGMCPGYIDPLEKGWTGPIWISEFNQHECLWLELPRSWLPIAQQACKPLNDTEGDGVVGSNYRMSSRFFNMASLEPYARAQCPDFINKVYKQGCSITPIKMPTLPKTLIRDAKEIDINRTPIADVGALAPGNYTIGPAAGDNYPTYNGAGGIITAINVAPAMAGDITGTLNGNIAEVANTILSQTIGAGNTLLFNSNGNHNGDPTQGFLITVNCNGVHCFDLRHSGPGTLEMCDLHMRWVLDTAPRTLIYQRLNPVASQCNFHDLLLDGNGLAQGGVWIQDVDPVVHTYNNVGWDTTAQIYRIILGNANSLYENNAAYAGATVGFEGTGQAGTYQNNTAYDCGVTDYDNIGGATGTNNRSSDATAANANWLVGAGNTINAVVAADVQSVVDGNAAFFDITGGGPLDSAGVANGIVARTTCIRNRQVPNGVNGGTSVGPAEIVTPDDDAVNVAQYQSHISTAGGISLGLF